MFWIVNAKELLIALSEEEISIRVERKLAQLRIPLNRER